jgi:threonine dehydrogenase-like Zn-dependent dehydrogenase
MLRVPGGEFNCLKLPDDARERQTDYVMLSDIFPTGWHAVEMSGLLPGESVVIYGAGPVGLMAAHSAVLKGAAKIMVVDRRPDDWPRRSVLSRSTTRKYPRSTR